MKNQIIISTSYKNNFQQIPLIRGFSEFYRRCVYYSQVPDNQKINLEKYGGMGDYSSVSFETNKILLQYLPFSLIFLNENKMKKNFNPNSSKFV